MKRKCFMNPSVDGASGPMRVVDDAPAHVQVVYFAGKPFVPARALHPGHRSQSSGPGAGLPVDPMRCASLGAAPES